MTDARTSAKGAPEPDDRTQAVPTADSEPPATPATTAALAVHRHRWYDEWPIYLVLLGVASGLAVVASNHFRRGSGLIALSLLLAAVLRAVLPESRAGVLVVRSRWIDVLTTGFLFVVLAVLVLTVPPPSV